MKNLKKRAKVIGLFLIKNFKKKLLFLRWILEQSNIFNIAFLPYFCSPKN
jgi:hypothetical protein